MKKTVYLSLFLFFLSFAIPLFSNPFYVSTHGDDQNDGTNSKPFASLSGAMKKIQSLRNNDQQTGNVVLVIRQGEYRLSAPIILTNDLWDGKDTLFIRGEEENRPVIKGSIQLDSFEKVSDNLWKITIPGTVQYGKDNIGQLFVNGKRAVKARTPNQGEMFKTGRVHEIVVDSNNTITGGMAIQKIPLTEGQFNILQPAFSEIPNVIISINHAWDRTKAFIQNVSSRDSSLFIINRPMPSWNTLNNTSQFYFENAKAFLDAPGEWFLDDKGIMWYIPQKEDDIKEAKAEIPITDQLLIINGNRENAPVKNIFFENISFQHTRHLMPPTGEGPNQAAAIYPAAIELNYAKNIAFNHCEIANISNYAIWFKESCSHSKITKSHIHDLGMGGIKIGNTRKPVNESSATNNIIIDNSIIQSGGYEVPTGVGIIIFHASDNTISHNDIGNFRYTGISVGWVWGYTPSISKRNKIIYNHIHHLGWGELSDMGGVYTLGESEGTIVSNNVIHDIYSYGYGGWGLYTDEGSTGITMENNLVYNCKSAGFHQHYGKENLIRNNIFAFNLMYQLQATRIEEHLSFTFTNNIIYFNRGSLLGKSHAPNWPNVNKLSDYNCYWDTRSRDIRFDSLSFKEWQAQGNDRHSVIADPGFVNPDQFDFRLKQDTISQTIGFKPFDYSKAGVYGDPLWIEKSNLDPAIINAYDKAIKAKIEGSN